MALIYLYLNSIKINFNLLLINQIFIKQILLFLNNIFDINNNNIFIFIYSIVYLPILFNFTLIKELMIFYTMYSNIVLHNNFNDILIYLLNISYLIVYLILFNDFEINLLSIILIGIIIIGIPIIIINIIKLIIMSYSDYFNSVVILLNYVSILILINYINLSKLISITILPGLLILDYVKVININFGPAHPAAHGVFRLLLNLNNERIISFYIHRVYYEE